MKLFFHIGAGKCASSSIQQYFSYNNIQGKFAYARIEKDGRIIVGKELYKKAQTAPSNYTSSPLQEYTITIDFMNQFENSLNYLSQSYQCLFFSSEGLQNSPESFIKLQQILMPHSLEIIYIIRPPVQWLNSAWWQWRQWDYGIYNVDDWINKTVVSKSWIENYHKFNQIPCIEKINLLTLQRNIIEQLCNIMKINYLPSQDSVNNESSSAELLNFLTLKKHLRPVHSPRYEFILSRHLIKRTKANWILSEENIKTTLENSKEANLELAKLISNENILKNKAWWDISYYEKDLARFNRNLDLPYETIADMLEEAYTVICSLDTNIRKLKANNEAPASAKKKVENRLQKNNQVDLTQQAKSINAPSKSINKDKIRTNSSTITPSLLETFKNIIFQPIIKKQAFAHCNLGNHKLAESIVQNIIANNPTTAWAYYILGKVQWQKGQEKQALSNLQKAIDLEPQTQYFKTFKASCKKKTLKLVATLLVRDEIDIVEENIKFHLSMGVDFIVATDNGSIDGTRDILLKYQKLGLLELIDEPEHNYSQEKWVNTMVKVARDKYKADWVINLDADEFYYSKQGNLKDDLELLDDYNIILLPRLNMFPATKTKTLPPFYNFIKAKNAPAVKCVIKAKDYIHVEMGSHNADMYNKKSTTYDGIIIHHYFIRSYKQFEYNTIISGEALLKLENRRNRGNHMIIRYNLYLSGKLEEEYFNLISDSKDATTSNYIKDYFNKSLTQKKL